MPFSQSLFSPQLLLPMKHIIISFLLVGETTASILRFYAGEGKHTWPQLTTCISLHQVAEMYGSLPHFYSECSVFKINSGKNWWPQTEKEKLVGTWTVMFLCVWDGKEMGQVNQQLSPIGKPCEEKLRTSDFKPAYFWGPWWEKAAAMEVGVAWWLEAMSGEEKCDLKPGLKALTNPESYPYLTMTHWCLREPVSSMEIVQTSISSEAFTQHLIISGALNCIHCNVNWTKTHSRVRKQNQLFFFPLVII